MKHLRNFFILIIAIIVHIYLSPVLHLINPIKYSVSLPAKFENALSPNTKLDIAEKLLVNDVFAPEALAVYDGKIYTGLENGKIVEISTNKVIDVSLPKENCAGIHDGHKCGRPAGLTFNKDGRLYVVDLHHGLYSVNIKTGKRTAILSSETLVDGLPLNVLNDIVLDEKEQALYFTQSSTKWNASQVFFGILEHESSGRLLKYDLITKKTSVLLKDLSYANGIELTHDGQAILVAVFNDHKILKYFIRGPKKGTHTVLLNAMPGQLDNISRSKHGTYWVGIENGRSLESNFMPDKLDEHPLIRKIILFAFNIITTPIGAIMQLLPYDSIKELGFKIQTCRIIIESVKSYGLIVEFDDTGKILQSLHSPSGNVAHISEVLEHNGYLYLASWSNHYVGRLKL